MKPTKLKSGTIKSGYNQYHLNAIYDVLNKVFVNAVLQPKPQANERKAFIEMLNSIELKTPTIFIADRGYPSWNMYAHFKHKKNAEFLIRVPNQQNILIKDLPMEEFDITRDITITYNTAYKNKLGYQYIHVKKNKMTNREYTGGTSFIDWDFGMFETLHLRIVRFKITDNTYETIITSLSKDEFPLEEIKKLYNMRWRIETSFRQLKYGVGLTNLHSRKDVFVRQEIFAKLTMYNFCERMLTATNDTFQLQQTRNKKRKYKYMFNRSMSIRICFDFFRGQIKEEYLNKLLFKYTVPIRPNRKDNRKIKPKHFVSFNYRIAA